MYQISGRLRKFYREDLYTGNVIVFQNYDEFLWEVFCVFGHNDPDDLSWKERIPKPNDSYDDYLRRYLYFDDENRNLDLKNYEFAAMNKYTNTKRKRSYQTKNDVIKSRMKLKYRKDAIPFLTKHIGKNGFRSFSRGTKKTLKLASDPEYGRYIRKKAIPKETDNFREKKNHESWKNQKKKRQWM